MMLLLANGGSPEYQGFMGVAALLMALVTLWLIVLVPMIQRRRRRREGLELKKRVEKSKADILADGKVEGPKGPYVHHTRWGVGATAGHAPLSDGSTRPPRPGGYYGSV